MPFPLLPQALHEELDAVLALIVDALRVRQADYQKANGRYWQGIKTHDVVPGKETPAAPVKTRKAREIAETWTTLSQALPASMMFSMTVDTYKTPAKDGYGFIITARTNWKGDVFMRSWNTGPDPSFEHDWQYVPPLI
jgi:hypothetical protein